MSNVLKKIIVAAIIAAMSISFLTAFTEPEDGLELDGETEAVSTKIVVKSVDYDPEDKKVDFEFKHNVQYKKNVKVTITYGKSKKNYVTSIQELSNKSLEVKVRKLKYGRVYKYKINGIRRKGAKSYKTISGTFRAIDR